MLPFFFPIAQIGVDPLLWLPKCSPAKRFDERGELDYRIFTASIYLRCFRWEVLFSKASIACEMFRIALSLGHLHNINRLCKPCVDWSRHHPGLCAGSSHVKASCKNIDCSPPR